MSKHDRIVLEKRCKSSLHMWEPPQSSQVCQLPHLLLEDFTECFKFPPSFWQVIIKLIQASEELRHPNEKERVRVSIGNKRLLGCTIIILK